MMDNIEKRFKVTNIEKSDNYLNEMSALQKEKHNSIIYGASFAITFVAGLIESYYGKIDNFTIMTYMGMAQSLVSLIGGSATISIAIDNLIDKANLKEKMKQSDNSFDQRFLDMYNNMKENKKTNDDFDQRFLEVYNEMKENSQEENRGRSL